MNEEQKVQGAYGFLCRGRSPFAIARLCGEENDSEVRGEVSFYSTPVGVLIHAHVSGLEEGAETGQTQNTYGLCLCDNIQEPCYARKKDGSGQRGNGYYSGICSAMPALYEKSGQAWCSVLTGKISPADLSGRKLTVHMRKHDSGYCGMSMLPIASGEIRCAGACQ